MVNHGLFQFLYPAYKWARHFHPALAVYNFLESINRESYCYYRSVEKFFYFYSPNIFKMRQLIL
jgi:hypothetical protein